MRDNIDLVIFGSQGDLAKRKLLPALYRLDKADLLPDNARIASVARHQISTNICLLYTSPSPRDQRGSGMAC